MTTLAPARSTTAPAESGVYRVIPRVPIFDAHAPITKQARDPKEISEENPEGLVEVEVGADEDDLREMAANANAECGRGRPPSLQIGHTRLEDLPEPYLPRHVGFTANHQVGTFEGRPCLFADLHVLASQYAEASTYPRPSAERFGWDEPGRQGIKAVALLRREPERDLGLIPYKREGGGVSLLCYARDNPERSIMQTANQIEEQALVDVAIRCGLTRRVDAVRRLAEDRAAGRDRPVTNYAKTSPNPAVKVPMPGDPASRRRILDHAIRTGLDVESAWADLQIRDLAAKLGVQANYAKESPAPKSDYYPTDQASRNKLRDYAGRKHMTTAAALKDMKAKGLL